MSPATKTGHDAAFKKWSAAHETERKRRRISAGRTVPGFPRAPASPDDIRYLMDYSPGRLTLAMIAELCDVHRTTVMRWLDGSVQIPRSAFAVLRFHAEGVPPGCGERWRGFSWSGDTLTCPDGKTTLTALEIASLGHKNAAIDALTRKCARLERQLVEMTARIDWGCANDAYSAPTDARSSAFTQQKRKAHP